MQHPATMGQRKKIAQSNRQTIVRVQIECATGVNMRMYVTFGPFNIFAVLTVRWKHKFFMAQNGCINRLWCVLWAPFFSIFAPISIDRPTVDCPITTRTYFYEGNKFEHFFIYIRGVEKLWHIDVTARNHFQLLGTQISLVHTHTRDV